MKDHSSSTEKRDRPGVYYLQNDAIHQARAELEASGVLDPRAGLEQIRDMAAEINPGVRSISSLSLEQRSLLIDRLIDLGARVKNPHLYDSDFAAEAAPGQKVIRGRFGSKEKELRMLDTLAAKIDWNDTDGYLRLCNKLIGAPRPRNGREITNVKLVLNSILSRQPAQSPPERV